MRALLFIGLTSAFLSSCKEREFNENSDTLSDRTFNNQQGYINAGQKGCGSNGVTVLREYTLTQCLMAAEMPKILWQQEAQPRVEVTKVGTIL